MNPDKYKQEVNFELRNIDQLIFEISSLVNIIGNKTPDIVQISAMSTFVAQFYSGIKT
jgi:hypothetical protein